MAKNKSSILKANNFYREMSDYWDTHDLTDHWVSTPF
jgi:predicted transcriptional regulator